MGWTMKASEVITDPWIASEVAKIQEAFSKPGADGIILFIKMRDLLIRQAEINFENEVRDYPYGLDIPKLGLLDFPDDAMMQWLRERYSDDDYVLMPVNAQGKYKDHCNWIYFKDPSAAVLFKLTWL